MRAPLFLISLLLSSAGCSDPKTYEGKAGVEPRAAAASTSATAASASAASAGDAFAFAKTYTEAGGGSLEFEYSWPAAVGREPQLAALLKQNLDNDLAQTKESWEASYADCPTDAVSCRTYSFSNAYQVVADLPRFLSLSRDFAEYTGGAHGIYDKSGTVWDREAKALVDPKAMFGPGLAAALGEKACAALDAERRKRRDGAIAGDASEWPNNCPTLDEAALLVGSSNGKTFDRVGIYYGPYVAGPYAEGAYEVDLPVDAAILGAVRPDYAKAFSVKG